MKKGLFLYCSDKRTAFNFEKKLKEELGLKLKEIFNDLAAVESDVETILLIDQGDIPSDYHFKGKNYFILTHGMDFSRWKNFYRRGIDVIKIDDHLYYLGLKLSSLGYRIIKDQETPEEDIVFKPRFVSDRIDDNFRKGITTIYSIKDGIGKTNISLSLAAYTRKNTSDTRVVILDLDSCFSGIRKFVDKNSGVSEVDLGAGSVLLELGKKMYKHEKTDLFLVPYEKEIETDQEKTSPRLVDILEELKRGFDLIVIDTGSQINNLPLTAISCSSTLFLITDHRNYIQRETVDLARKTLHEQGIIVPNTYFVINKVKHAESFSTGDFEKRFSFKVAGVIDYDGNISDYEDKKLIYSLSDKKNSLLDCIKSMSSILGFESERRVKSKFRDIFS